MFVIPYESKEDNSNDLSIEYGVHGQKVRLDKSLEKDAIEKIRLILAAHDEKIKRGEEERRKSEEKVKTGLSKYIEDVFTNLKESEKRNKKFAFWLYLVSIVSLIATIVIAVIFVANRDWQTENIGYMIAYGDDLVGAELPDGTHSEEFPAIKQRYFDIAKEFSKMLKTVINCQLEELLCKSN